MLESMGEYAPFIDPDFILMLNWVFFIGSSLTALMILFPAFISLKADGKVEWSWMTVFIPLYILDGLAFRVVLSRPVSSKHSSHKPNEQEQEEESNGQYDGSASKPMSPLRKFILKSYSILYFALFVLFQVFLALKLDEKTEMSWSMVFSPWIVIELFNLIDVVHSVAFELKAGIPHFQEASTSHDEETVSHTRKFTLYETMALLLDYVGVWFLRVLQAILIILKLQSTRFESTSWAFIFLPTWIWGFMKILSIYLLSIDFKTSPTKRMMVISSTVFFVISAIFVYFTTGLLVKRLDSGDGYPKVAVILIPVFIITGFLFCCIGCCMPCVASCVRMDLENQLNSQNDQAQIVVSSNMRIENTKQHSNSPSSSSTL